MSASRGRQLREHCGAKPHKQNGSDILLQIHLHGTYSRTEKYITVLLSGMVSPPGHAGRRKEK